MQSDLRIPGADAEPQNNISANFPIESVFVRIPKLKQVMTQGLMGGFLTSGSNGFSSQDTEEDQ